MPAPILCSHPSSLQINPEPLTPASFAPFGTVISSPLPPSLSRTVPPLSSLPASQPSPVLANQSSALRYSPISPLLNNYRDACPSGQPAFARMSMFSCFPRRLRTISGSGSGSGDGDGVSAEIELFDVRVLERHPFTTQTFVPLGLGSAGPSTQGRVLSCREAEKGQGGRDASEVDGGGEGNDQSVFLVIVAPTRKGEVASARSTNRIVTVYDPPDLERIRAFVATGDQAVTYGAGTWHAPMVVLGRRRVDFVVVQFVNGVEEEDCQEAAWGEGIVVNLGNKGQYGRELGRKPSLWSKL